MVVLFIWAAYSLPTDKEIISLRYSSCNKECLLKFVVLTGPYDGAELTLWEREDVWSNTFADVFDHTRVQL